MTRLVAGFEGTVAPRRTPAWAAPIVLDEDGCRMRDVGGGRWELVSGVPFVFQPTATKLDQAILFRPDTACLLLGPDDQKAVAGRAGNGPLAALARWLCGTRAVDHEELGASTACNGVYAVLLCTREETEAARRLICNEARWRILQALRDGKKTDVYEAAWWLQRAAVNADDELMAMAALERSAHPERAKDLLEAIVLTARLSLADFERGTDPRTIEDVLKRADAVLVELQRSKAARG
jgi:hypothetical protein